MKKHLKVAGLALAAALLTMSACAVQPVKRFAEAAHAVTSIILPEYLKYVSADPNLDEDAKKARRVAVAELQKTIDEARRDR